MVAKAKKKATTKRKATSRTRVRSERDHGGGNGRPDPVARRRKTGLGSDADMAAAAEKRATAGVPITHPDFQLAQFQIVGNAPLVIHAFGPKALKQLMDLMAQGDKAKNKTKKDRPPRGEKEFALEFEDAKHVCGTGGWLGFSAVGIRSAAIRASKLCGWHMSDMKQAFFVIADGFDQHSGDPLCRITKGKPRQHVGPVRLTNGAPDIRSRPMWAPGWEAKPIVMYDASLFSLEECANLMVRIGLQIGICEGRPYATKPDGGGMGWGTFDVTHVNALGPRHEYLKKSFKIAGKAKKAGRKR